MKYIIKFLQYTGLEPEYIDPISGMVSMVLFLLFLYIVWHFFKIVSLKFLYSKYFKIKNVRWFRAIRETNFFAAFGYLGAGFIAHFSLNFFFPDSNASLHNVAFRIISIYFQVWVLIFINKILTIFSIVHETNKNIPVKGVVQFIKIFINFFGALIILAYFIGKEPTYFISALGVMASILMIVFKDTILGLTASWQLSMNNMLHIGDWIEMPQHKADGTVVDISLTTVYVKNWDNTIITIPAYDLISGSFQNWRGMSESGGRRIKRSIFIDIQSIKFVDTTLLKKLQKFELLQSYISEKEKEIKEYNVKHNTEDTIYNGRYLTNVGLFRIYCQEYIKSRTYINKNFTAMVRQLSMGAQGLPLEIYCFTSTTEWEPYESYQSDIFDHLLSVIEEFDLFVFQNPTGWNFSSISINKKI